MKHRQTKTMMFAVLLLWVGLCLANFFHRPDSYSLAERRALAEKPQLTMESLANGSYMDAYERAATDQFPLREPFRTLKALSMKYVFAAKENNNLYEHSGYLAAMNYPLDTAALVRQENRIRQVLTQYTDETNRIYLSIIPDKNLYLAEEAGIPSVGLDEIAEHLENSLGMKRIVLEDLLSIEDYYYTDTHWKQEKLLPIAGRLGEAMGFDVTKDFQEKVLDIPFKGVYAGQSALPCQNDTIVYLVNQELMECTVESYNTGIAQEAKMYDMDKAYGKDPYEMYLSGSDALLKIYNPGGEAGRRLILFRDSFASSLTPLLVHGYEEIDVVDLRYIQISQLGNYLDFTDADVLFLYSTLILNH